MLPWVQAVVPAQSCAWKANHEAAHSTSIECRGKSSLGQSEQFKTFRSTFALRQLAVDLNDGEWRFYDGGPKNTPLLLCLPGASGTAECFYRLMDGLCPKGYRVVAAQHPPYYTLNEFILGMDAFVDALEASSVHIFGASLGGLLAQQYAIARPKRVASLILCNSFYSTTAYAPTAGSLATSMYQVTPYFVLKNMILSSFNNDAAAIAASPEVAEAVDFVVEQMQALIS
jgi:maspardin